jgi:hypothetical protein
MAYTKGAKDAMQDRQPPLTLNGRRNAVARSAKY